MLLGLVLALLALGGCAYPYFPDHHLVHPARAPDGIVEWTDSVDVGELRIHLRGARPGGEGPFATVLVHPEGGKTAVEMQGVVWDLAAHGYAAIAADYERRIDGAYERTLFAWRSPADATAIVDVVDAYPFVDRDRVAALGFSQGGVFSLLIAAYAPERIAAVVSYYPVTDFPRWFALEDAGAGRRFAFTFVRWYFRQQSGASSEEQFEQYLVGASAYYVADRIRAPVLLVHGADDTTAPASESIRMADRLVALGTPVELLVVPDAVHIFNFRQPEQAGIAWDATLEWLELTLRPLDRTAPDLAARSEPHTQCAEQAPQCPNGPRTARHTPLSGVLRALRARF